MNDLPVDKEHFGRHSVHLDHDGVDFLAVIGDIVMPSYVVDSCE